MLVNSIKKNINRKNLRFTVALFAYGCLLLTLATFPHIKQRIFDPGTYLLEEIVENINARGGESFEIQFGACGEVTQPYETFHVPGFFDLPILHFSHFLKVIPFLLSDLPPPVQSVV